MNLLYCLHEIFRGVLFWCFDSHIDANFYEKVIPREKLLILVAYFSA